MIAISCMRSPQTDLNKIVHNEMGALLKMGSYLGNEKVTFDDIWTGYK